MRSTLNEWKAPHIIKIPEALSAIADLRYERKGNYLFVKSSDYSKKYTVEIFENGYSSNDNMSYNNGILGYPIVVSLMLESKIEYNRYYLPLFNGINWTKLNEQYNKNFSISYEVILNRFKQNNYDYIRIKKSIESSYEQLLVLIPFIQRKIGKYSYNDSLQT